MHLDQQAEDLGEQMKKERQEAQDEEVSEEARRRRGHWSGWPSELGSGNTGSKEQSGKFNEGDVASERRETEQCEKVEAVSRGVGVMSIAGHERLCKQQKKREEEEDNAEEK